MADTPNAMRSTLLSSLATARLDAEEFMRIAKPGEAKDKAAAVVTELRNLTLRVKEIQ
jgi:hypothetical protein